MQKDIIALWNKALSDPHPILIIATSIFLSIPRTDIGMIIVERDNSRGYKSIGRPFIDMRYVAERLSKNIGADFLIGDSCLRVETIERETDGEFVEFAPLSFRSLSTATEELIDMKKYRADAKGFRALSDEFLNLVKTNKQENELLFVFAARKGVSPSTVCSDCETVLSCRNCNTPLILHGRDDNRFFLCNRCGKKYDTHTTCKTCDSWRLKPLGIGSELVEAEILSAMPDVKIFRIDKTTATTHKRAISIVDKWLASPGSVLIGTEMALTYLDKKIDNCAIATLDAYFSIPDFRISEKIFSIILKMRSMAYKRFLLQTRRPEEPLLSYAWKGNMIDFFREEISLRKALGFPPFTVLVKLSSGGTKDRVTEDMNQIKETLKDYTVDVFPAFVALPRGHVGMHALVRVPKKDWPDKKLISLIETLPQSFTVNINPESLL
jgi:primosomal protein N' (replication factor Y)